MSQDKQKILLVGNPNIGKSALFHALSGEIIELEKYKDNRIEILKTSLNKRAEIIYTQGIYEISRFSDESYVVFDLIENLKENDFVINIVNADTLQRDLFLTLHLIDCKVPLVLVINQITKLLSEKEKINYEKLAQKLNIKVFFISTLTNEGIQDLKDFILSEPEVKADIIQDPELVRELEKALENNNSCNIPLKNHFEALMWLESDKKLLKRHDCEYCDIEPEKNSKQKMYVQRQERVNNLIESLNNKFTEPESVLELTKEKPKVKTKKLNKAIWQTFIYFIICLVVFIMLSFLHERFFWY